MASSQRSSGQRSKQSVQQSLTASAWGAMLYRASEFRPRCSVPAWRKTAVKSLQHKGVVSPSLKRVWHVHGGEHMLAACSTSIAACPDCTTHGSPSHLVLCLMTHCLTVGCMPWVNMQHCISTPVVLPINDFWLHQRQLEEKVVGGCTALNQGDGNTCPINGEHKQQQGIGDPWLCLQDMRHDLKKECQGGACQQCCCHTAHQRQVIAGHNFKGAISLWDPLDIPPWSRLLLFLLSGLRHAAPGAGKR